MNNKTLRAIATLVGTTIGAGIFGIPYAILKVGFGLGMVYLLLLGLMVLLLNLLYGEIILRTPGDHQLGGYGEIYLGKKGKILATVGLLVGLYGAMLAYLIKIGEFMALISNLPYPLLFSLAFFTFASITILLGLKTLSKIELILVGLMLIFIFILALIGSTRLSLDNYQLTNIHNLFLPYGVILFALIATPAIPEIEEILRQNHRQLKKAIIIGSLIPFLSYLLFAVIIIGVSGSQTSEDAISNLWLFLPKWIVKLGAGLGILTMATSFLALGYSAREVWHRDLKFAKIPAWALVVFPSLALFLLGARNFIQILEYTGALTGGLTGVLLVLCFYKAQKLGQRPPAYVLNLSKLLLWVLGGVFALGMLAPFLSRL